MISFGSTNLPFSSRYLTTYLYPKMILLNILCCCISPLHALANLIRLSWLCLIVIIWNIWSHIWKHFLLAAARTNRSVMMNDNVTSHISQFSWQKMKQYCTPVIFLIYPIRQLFLITLIAPLRHCTRHQVYTNREMVKHPFSLIIPGDSILLIQKISCHLFSNSPSNTTKLYWEIIFT